MTTSFKRQRHRRITPNRVFARFLLALVVIVAAIVASFAVSMSYARNGIYDEEILNISGRQRMLSQRIIHAAFRYNETRDPKFRRVLFEGLGDFTKAHHWLLGKIEPGTDIWDHYHGDSGAQLDAHATEFISAVWGIAHAQTSANAPIELLQQAEEEAIFFLLDGLHQAVLLFEEAANNRAAVEKTIQKGAMLFILLVVAFIAVFVFLPAKQQLAGLISQLRSQAELDPLTGLSNRRHFIAQTQMHLVDHQHEIDCVFVIALDLDGFKQVNDTLGHPVGDAVLRSVANDICRLCASEPNLDAYELARQGGDEFLIFGVVTRHKPSEVIESLSDKLIDAVGRPIDVTIQNASTNVAQVGVSVGSAIGCSVSRDIDVLISNADIALYASKQAGKGVATAFQASMRDEAEARNRWMNEIKRGLNELEFEAFFQPQVEIATGRVVGLEALARWRHPEHGLLAPGHFVDKVERAHKSDLLDGQIILHAIEALKSLRQQNFYIERMSVNASGALLRDPAFSETFAELVKDNLLQPESFTVEILESVVLDSGKDEAITSVGKLIAEGFSVAIDDFGAGYSSLESVAMIGGTILKIDQSLVKQLGDPRVHKILSAAVSMGHGLGADVYAEGVESTCHLDQLRKMGARVMQGYLVAAPMSLPDLVEWLTGLEQSISENGRPPVPKWHMSRIQTIMDRAG